MLRFRVLGLLMVLVVLVGLLGGCSSGCVACSSLGGGVEVFSFGLCVSEVPVFEVGGAGCGEVSVEFVEVR